MLFVLPVIAAPDAPVAPGWWPLPPGWWLLGLTLLLVLLWMVYLLLRRFIRPARAAAVSAPPVRELALAALDELEQRRGLEGREAAYRLNEILQAAVPVEKQRERADQQEWQCFWQELALRYRPVMTAGEADIKRWLKLARNWIEQLPPDDTTDANGGARR